MTAVAEAERVWVRKRILETNEWTDQVFLLTHSMQEKGRVGKDLVIISEDTARKLQAQKAVSDRAAALARRQGKTDEVKSLKAELRAEQERIQQADMVEQAESIGVPEELTIDQIEARAAQSEVSTAKPSKLEDWDYTDLQKLATGMGLKAFGVKRPDLIASIKAEREAKLKKKPQEEETDG